MIFNFYFHRICSTLNFMFFSFRAYLKMSLVAFFLLNEASVMHTGHLTSGLFTMLRTKSAVYFVSTRNIFVIINSYTCTSSSNKQDLFRWNICLTVQICRQVTSICSVIWSNTWRGNVFKCWRVKRSCHCLSLFSIIMEFLRKLLINSWKDERSGLNWTEVTWKKNSLVNLFFINIVLFLCTTLYSNNFPRMMPTRIQL